MTVYYFKLWEISIHALREEGDFGMTTMTCFSEHFYPRPPRGGRRRRFIGLSSLDQFLSTPSARRATQRQQVQPL